MKTNVVLTEQEIERENSEFFNPEFYEYLPGMDSDHWQFYDEDDYCPYYCEDYYSSEIPSELFTTEFDHVNLYSLDYYKKLVQDLGIHDYIFEMYKLNPFDDGLIICNRIIICNELCFFNHSQIVKYFDFFVLVKKFIFHLTDEIGLENGRDFSCNEWLDEERQEVSFTIYQTESYDNGSHSFIIDENATEERFQAFIDLKFKDNEHVKNYERARKLSEILR
jgi:hypothetical protein